ncbi:hypothetical protein ACGYQ5_14425 [Burkholderia pseudomallei]
MVLAMWVVYERPTDYPEGYIARRWTLANGAGLQPSTNEVFTGDSLDDVRRKLPQGLHRIHRDPRDEPQIVEVWL